MFQRSGLQKTAIVDMGKISNIKFLRPTIRNLNHRKKRRLLHTQKKKHNHLKVLHNPFYSPSYVAGRVLSLSMLESVLYQLYFQPSILEVVRSFCGTHDKSHTSHSPGNDYQSSSICCISVPPECVNQPYINLYESLTKLIGIIPIGILRDEIYPSLGNRLPFVITNPMPSMLLKQSDLIYVLATPSQLN